MPTETTLNSLKVHKVPDFETWEENYNQTNGIGTSDVVVIPPEELKKGVLPPQANNSGKFLTTDGNGNTSWANETDPVFGASPAAGITQNDINSWDAKVSDDHKWNDVSLTKTSSAGYSGYVPVLTDTTSITANLRAMSDTPSSGKIAVYNSSKYLTSTTPSANDNSTKVATTAYVDAAIPNTSSFITTEIDPTVPSWAKASTKPSYTASEVGAVATSAVGAANGVVPLNASSKIDSTYLPSYVDDVIEGYYYNSKFYTTSAHTTEITGETGKIFVDLSTNKTYRYGGSSFTEISQGSVVSVSRDLTSGTKIGTLTINGTGTDLYAPTPETFTVTGGASTIVSDNLTANRALISNTNGKVAVSDVTSTELGYLDGVTSAIQTQIDGKQAKITASGLLKGDGSGGVSAATAGTDYQAPLPSQTNNSGKFLTTNGSALSWGTVDALPSQTNNSGKFLTTNGTSASWTTISVPSASTTTPSMDGTASYGSGTTWARADHVHPSDTSRQSQIKTGTITITTTWSGSGPYTQTVTPSGYTATANTKIDIQPTAAQIAQLITDGVTSLLVSNSNGTLIMYATGAAPTTAMTIQVTCTEVTAA